MKCEMCGSEQEILYRTDVEDAEMTVCEECSSYGDVIEKVKQKRREEEPATESKAEKREVPDRPSIITMVKHDYPKIIKDKRERRGLKQSELARQVGEKESVIHKLETGHMEPSIDLARKLERFLKISLIEEYEEKPQEDRSMKDREVTIGDMIQLGG